jgi:hypothetical protein
MTETLDTHRRALAVNLDASSYGTFAEIGAGQEVARWFLQVGGAAGTVAKTISAYDMAFSDAIYGKASRYVSRERLVEMLDHEYPLLLERLGAARGARTRFFVFADTVSARNYAGTNECHGWLGLRFQTKPGAKPSDVLLHVNMRDPTNLQQQQALGILGVNLVHAAFFAGGTRAKVLQALFSELSLERIELDYVELSGPAFPRPDERALGVELVRLGLANAVVLTRSGELVTPGEFLRKTPLVLERRALRAPEPAAGRRLAMAARELAREFPGLERPPLGLFELSLARAEGARMPPAEKVLRHATELGARGFPLLLTRYPRGAGLTEYVRRYTREPLVLAASVAELVALLQVDGDDELVGGAFESFGRQLAEKVRVYVLPLPVREFRSALRRAGIDARRVRLLDERTVHADGVVLAPPLDHLLAYLIGAGWVVPLGRAPAKGVGRDRKR